MPVVSSAVLNGGSWSAILTNGVTYYVSGSVSAYGVTTLSSIGTLTITSGAVVSGVMISGGTNPTVNVQGGGMMISSTEINGYTNILNGGVISGNLLNSDQVTISNGGSSVNDTFINSGSSADGNAYLYVSSGAYLAGATMSNGAVAGLSAWISSGATVSGLVLGSGSFASIGSGATISSQITTGSGSVLSLGAQYGSGTANVAPSQQGATVLTGGNWTASSVSGVTYYVSGTTSVAGTVVLSSINRLTILSGAVVSGATLSGGTTPSVYVSAGGVMTDSLEVNGYTYVSSGGVLSGNILNSNVVSLYAGASSVKDTYINSGRYADGYSDATVASGASVTSPYLGTATAGGFVMTVSSGATLSDPTLIGTGGGRLRVSGNMTNTEPDPCYLADTMIAMRDGEKPVQDIRRGDEVLAWVDGQFVTRPIVWAGRTRATIRTDLPDDLAGYPVRIIRDALEDGIPSKDLLVTAEHCLFLDGSFIPVRMLVNDRSIFYDKSITDYEYYHIETEYHSVIRADGVLTESFLDTGNRSGFTQDGTVVAFGARTLSWEESAAAPLNVAHDFAEAITRRIIARADRAGTVAESKAMRGLTSDTEIHIITDQGERVSPRRSGNGMYMFTVPSEAKDVRILSRSSRPHDVIAPYVNDRRHLGILVRSIFLFRTEGMVELDAFLTEDRLEGWNGRESYAVRWTTGNALVRLPDRLPNEMAVLALRVEATGTYPVMDVTDVVHQQLRA